MSFTTLTKTAAVPAATSKAAALSALALGAFFIYVLGFSPIEVMHNAAHDTRHSSAFPCH